ncbi:MAG: hypoxanthine phosphoribosyltransferase [Lachnospiraceae bacterium]|nr:hypoxanthine phosphoribosyltransferase [Lachnospiraceae bacterium]
MAEKITELISEEKIDNRIREIGAKLSEKFQGEDVVLVGILRGGAFFACELAKRIDIPVVMDFMCTSSYGNGTVSKGNVNIVKDLDENIEGKNVIIAEDIIDSGNTLKALKEILTDRNPKSLTLCTLLDKPSRREVQVDVNYVGFEINDYFVVGYGLDYAQKYRNLPYIGIVEFEN